MKWLKVCFLLLPGLFATGIGPQPTAQAQLTRQVNAPYFGSAAIDFDEMAVFWFGQVDATNNYADVRVGYNQQSLRVRVAAFDRRLWYDTTPTVADLENWDTVTLYLDLDHDGGSVPDADDYRLVGQLNWWEARTNYQAAYRGNGSSWIITTLPFSTTSGWRGNAPDDNTDDRGWVMDFNIPFSSLGLSTPPLANTLWGLAVVLHDRDDANGTPITDKIWPEAMSAQLPGTWSRLAFGLPTYHPPSAQPGGIVTVRQGLNGASVPDAAVGGTIPNLCPGETNYIWNEWGNANYSAEASFNLQNQSDVADWPCFAKYYVTFPLTAIPANKAIISATLTLHQFGGSDPSQAQPSLIQVFSIGEDWNSATLAWNNAPLALENVARTWVNVLPSFPGWPGVPSTWDVGRAVAEAYATGTPLRLALYEADSAYHSGKHFVSSETGDWNAVARPTLRVQWGDPIGTVDKSASSIAIMPAETLTYTLHIVGSGQPLTLTDQLPAGVSAPITYSPGFTYVPHRLTWAGQPTTGQHLTFTYVVTVTAAARTVLWNHAVLTQSNGLTDEARLGVWVDPWQVRLPLIRR